MRLNRIRLDLRSSAAFLLLSCLVACASDPAEREARRGERPQAVLADVIDDLEGQDRNDLASLAASEQRLADALWREPGHPDAWATVAALELLQGDRRGARASLDRALDLAPLDADAVLLRAQIALEDGSVSVAARLLDDAIRLAPGDLDLRELRAGVAFTAGDLDTAEQHLAGCEPLARDDAARARLAFHRGLIAESRLQMEEARDAFRAAHDLDPTLRAAAERADWLDLTLGH